MRRVVALGVFVVALAVVGLLAWLTSRSFTESPAASEPRAEPTAAPEPELRPEPPARPDRQRPARTAAQAIAAPRTPEALGASASTPPAAPGESSPPPRAGATVPAQPAGEAGSEEQPDTLRFEITKDGIRGAIDSVLPDLQACYEGWLQVGRPVRGKVRVSLRIEAERDAPEKGVITGAEVLDSELHHPLIEACLLNALSQPEFDPPPDGGKVMVTYPLVFDDEDPDDG